MFGVILTVGFTALLLYVLGRAASVRPLVGRPWRLGLVALGVVVWSAFFLARSVGHGGSGPLGATLEPVGMTLLGVVFLLSMALLVVDLVTAFGHVFRRWTPALRGGALVAGLLLSAAALVQGQRAPAVVSYEVALRDLPAALDGVLIVAVSDAHLGAGRGEAWLAARVEQMRALHPDVVVFVGDIFEGHGETPSDLPALRALSPRLGKWFVDGNHESHGQPGAGTLLLQRAGFQRLANESRELATGLVLAGVSDAGGHGRPEAGRDALALTLASRSPGVTVLLSHAPTLTELAAQSGVQLMLSGHTHGGQLWPFGYLVRTVYPLMAGRYEVEGMTVIVGRGVGTWGPPMRLWQRGELVAVTLRSVAVASVPRGTPGAVLAQRPGR